MKVPVSGKVYGTPEMKSLMEVVWEGHLTEGRMCERFKKKLSAYHKCKYVVLTNSGSSANLLALYSLLTIGKLSPGDKVLTFAVGFPTTVAPIIQLGLVPVLMDVDLGTYVPGLVDIPTVLQETGCKAVMAAHTLGNCFNYSGIPIDIPVITDACDAFQSSWGGGGTRFPTHSELTTLSFYPAHNICCAEGGAVLTKDAKLFRQLEMNSGWGRQCWCRTGCDNTCKKRFGWKIGELPEGYDHKYIYQNLGFNLKMTDLQGAIGNAQMDQISQFEARRRGNFNYIQTYFAENGYDRFFILPEQSYASDTVWFGYPLTIRDDAGFTRLEITQYLEEKGIQTRVLFGGNLARQPAFAGKVETYGTLENADKIMRDTFWVGCWHGLERKQMHYMAKCFSEYLDAHSNSRST